jgi:DNA-binding beta-propeller fold protein YncE
LIVLLGASSALFGVCGPFADVAADSFCPFVLEIFTLGITTGTSPTTYDPTSNVNRLQMAAFLSRSVDGVLKRGSRRAALDQFWTTQNDSVLGLTSVGSNLALLKSDGLDIWVANGDSVSRVRGTDAKLLETWTGATSAVGVLVAMGRVFVTGERNPGNLYRIDPSETAGAVTTVASTLGNGPLGIAFDGSRIWTANNGSSVSIVTPGATIPWTVTTVTAGFIHPRGILYDSANIWVADTTANTLVKLDSAGAVLLTVTAGGGPQFPAFDGGNIWVPQTNSNRVSVVRASNGVVLQTLTGNGLNGPWAAAFDGQRVLVTNNFGDSVSLWKAADLTPIGSFPTGAGTGPYGACSDGVNFWITLNGTGQLARF